MCSIYTLHVIANVWTVHFVGPSPWCPVISPVIVSDWPEDRTGVIDHHAARAGGDTSVRHRRHSASANTQIPATNYPAQRISEYTNTGHQLSGTAHQRIHKYRLPVTRHSTSANTQIPATNYPAQHISEYTNTGYRLPGTAHQRIHKTG